MANFMKSIYKELGIELRFLTAYHPQTQGQVENNNKWMETYLCMFCSHQQDDWADLLLMAEFAYNNHHHPSIDSTPFFANYGYHPMLTNIPNVAQSSDPDKRIQWIHETQEECKRAIERSQEVSKRAYDKWKGALWIVGPVQGPGVGPGLRACAPALGPGSYLLKDLSHLLRDSVPHISPTSCTRSLSRWPPGPRVWYFVTLDWLHLLYHTVFVTEPDHTHDMYI